LLDGDTRKRTYHEIPDVLSNDPDRWSVHLLQGGRPS
jgi:hypothetical protein